VVLQERAPGLRGWFATVHHVLGDASLADLAAEFEPFAVNAACTPSRILSADAADQISNLTADEGACWLSLSNFSSPKPATPPTMKPPPSPAHRTRVRAIPVKIIVGFYRAELARARIDNPRA
jgi:hypothetical protein